MATQKLSPTATHTSAAIPAFPRNAVDIVLGDDYDTPVTVYVGGAGDISCVPFNCKTTHVFKGLRAGQVLPVQVKRLNASGTTATNLVGMY